MAIADNPDATIVTPVETPPPAVPPAPETAIIESRAPEERISVASQWQLMWWRFRKHKVAMVSAFVVLIFYATVLFADSLAYADPYASTAQRTLLPPQTLHLFEDGRFAPFVYGIKGQRDLT